MKLNKEDSKGFLLGIVSSVVAIILWDIAKYNYKKHKIDKK